MEEVVPLTQPKWKDQALGDGRTIRIEMDFEKLPSINGNESELRELATNLVFNAVDAMPQGGSSRSGHAARRKAASLSRSPTRARA